MSAADLKISGSFHRRVFTALLGNGVSLASRILVQLAMVPLFLYFWSPERYGEWILLSSIPAYLALADLGMADAGGNAIAHNVAAGNVEKARTVRSAVLLFVSAGNIGLALVAALLFGILRVQNGFGFHAITGDELGWALAGLGLSVILGLQVSTLYATVRGIGRYSDQSMIQSAVALIELGAIAIALMLRPTADTIAGAMVVVRIGQWAFLNWHVRRHAPQLMRFSIRGTREQIKALLRPSLAFMAFPVSNAIVMQGYNILIGVALGPSMLVVYSTCATAARLLQTAFVMIYNTIMPETAILIGMGKMNFVRNIHRAILFCIVAIAPLMGVALYGFILLIFGYWVRGEVQLDHAALAIIILANVIKISYYPSFAILAGTLRHQRFSLASLAAAGTSLLASALMSSTIHQLYLLLIPTVVAETALFVIATSTALRVLHDRPAKILRQGPRQTTRLVRKSLAMAKR